MIYFYNNVLFGRKKVHVNWNPTSNNTSFLVFVYLFIFLFSTTRITVEKKKKNRLLNSSSLLLLCFLNQFVVITQWSIFAIHNLTEGNEENKEFISQLNMQGVANNQAVLEDMGLEVQTDANGLVVKKLKR